MADHLYPYSRPTMLLNRLVVIAIVALVLAAGDWQFEILRRSAMPGIVACLIVILMGTSTGYLRRRQLAGHIAIFNQTQEALLESETLFRLQFELSKLGLASWRWIRDGCVQINGSAGCWDTARRNNAGRRGPK